MNTKEFRALQRDLQNQIENRKQGLLLVDPLDIKEQLIKLHGTVTNAAKMLGKDHSYLYKRIRNGFRQSDIKDLKTLGIDV